MPVLNLYTEIPEFPECTPLEIHGIPVDRVMCFDNNVAVAVWVSLDELTKLKRQIEGTLERYKHLSNK